MALGMTEASGDLARRLGNPGKAETRKDSASGGPGCGQ